MQKQTLWRKSLPLVLALFVSGAAFADSRPSQNPGGYGMGPGMMGGYGMGPGMMGGYGPGPGMMYDGSGGYGPGMMGGYGPGMMGGYGMGAGMGMGPVWALELNDNQRRAIDNILAEQHKQHWAAMSTMLAAQGRLRELQVAEHWDEKAIAAVYDDMFKQQRLMIEASVRARNRIQDQLTTEQKEQLRRWTWSDRWPR